MITTSPVPCPVAVSPEVERFLFEVVTTPIEAVSAPDSGAGRVRIPGKMAILHRDSRQVLGVVSSSYRVVTNLEAVAMALEVCAKAFPGVQPDEWEPKRASGPDTLSYGSIDLLHRTHILSLWDQRNEADDPYTPYVRVTNSFNHSRALRFDLGFIRRHCNNGVIFEKDLASVVFSHSHEELAGWRVKAGEVDLRGHWEKFCGYLRPLKEAAVARQVAQKVVLQVLNFPAADIYRLERQHKEREELQREVERRHLRYETALGANAYALFNTLTDFAARPPALGIYHKPRSTIEERAGRWLRLVGSQAKSAKTIDWDDHLRLVREQVVATAGSN